MYYTGCVMKESGHQLKVLNCMSKSCDNITPLESQSIMIRVQVAAFEPVQDNI